MPIPKNLSSSSLANLDTELRVTDRIIRPSGLPAERLADKVPARINSFGLTEELYTAQWLLDWEGAASGDWHAHALTGDAHDEAVARDRALLMASSEARGGEENIVLSGKGAEDLCIGDTLVVSPSLKSADDIMATISTPKSTIRLQVSAPGDAPSTWFVRVLQEGELRKGDELVIESHPHPQWTVQRVADVLSSSPDEHNIAQLRELATLEALAAAGWRDVARQRVEAHDRSRYLTRAASGVAALAVAALSIAQW